MLMARIGERRARTCSGDVVVASEGKTSTAASLARVFALGGHRTIVVDADMRAPALHIALGAAPQPGLSELLTGRAAFQHVLRREPEPGACAAGSAPLANPTAALASPQMLWVLSALQQTYDYVIIDSPAAMAAADATRS